MARQILNFKHDDDRYKYFPEETRIHAAKLELRTLRWIYENYTQPGQTVLDPMSGVGSVHIGILHGLNTIGVEIHDKFFNLHQPGIDKIRMVGEKEDGLDPNTFGNPLMLHGDARRFLPIPCDIVVFSPPYGSVFKVSVASKKTHQLRKEKNINIRLGYGDEAGNIGNLTVYADYLNAMEEIYRLCYQSLPPGGKLVFITKDYIKNAAVVPVTVDNINVCMNRIGFKYIDWHLRETNPSLWQNIQRERRENKGIVKKGLNIKYEDIIVMEK